MTASLVAAASTAATASPANQDRATGLDPTPSASLDQSMSAPGDGDA